jgi:hypothetical protein
MLKPHRVLAEKVSSYADEASAFMRRRRHHRRPFVRIQSRSGDGLDLLPGDPTTDRVQAAVEVLLDLTP